MEGWADVGATYTPAEIRTSSLLIVGPAIYHTATSPPGNGKILPFYNIGICIMIRITNKIESAGAIFSYPADTQRETDYKMTIYNHQRPCRR